MASWSKRAESMKQRSKLEKISMKDRTIVWLHINCEYTAICAIHQYELLNINSSTPKQTPTSLEYVWNTILKINDICLILYVLQHHARVVLHSAVISGWIILRQHCSRNKDSNKSTWINSIINLASTKQVLSSTHTVSLSCCWVAHDSTGTQICLLIAAATMASNAPTVRLSTASPASWLQNAINDPWNWTIDSQL